MRQVCGGGAGGPGSQAGCGSQAGWDRREEGPGGALGPPYRVQKRLGKLTAVLLVHGSDDLSSGGDGDTVLGHLLPGPAFAVTDHKHHRPRLRGAMGSPTQDSRSPGSTHASVRLGISEVCLEREEGRTQQEDGGGRCICRFSVQCFTTNSPSSCFVCGSQIMVCAQPPHLLHGDCDACEVIFGGSRN